MTVWELTGLAILVIAMAIVFHSERSAVEMTPEKLADMAKAGGWMLVALAVLSCISIGLCIERGWTYWRAQGGAAGHRWRYDREVRQLAAEGRFDEALIVSEHEGSLPAALNATYYAKQDEETEKLRKSLQRMVQLDAVPYLAHNLDWIAALSRLAPMIGLLGTVWGMIGAFSSIASRMEVDPSSLANHIGLALTTTAAGLGVAIPGIALHCFLTEWARRIEIKLHKQGDDFFVDASSREA